MHKDSHYILETVTLVLAVILTLLGITLLFTAPLWLRLTLLLFAIGIVALSTCVFLRHRKQEQMMQEEPIGWRQGDRQLLGFIERMLKGCDNQRLSAVQIPTRSPFFFVFGVEIAALQGVDKNDTEQYARKEMQVCNILSEIFSAHSFWPMNIDGILICVINLRADPSNPLQTDALQKTMLPLLNKAVARLKQDGIFVRFSTSDVVVGEENLSLAYNHVVDVFDQLIFLNSDGNDTHIIIADPQKQSTHVDHVTRAKTERLFTNYTLSQDFVNAKIALLHLTEYELQDQEFSVTIKRLTSNRLEWSLDTLACWIAPETNSLLRGKLKDIAETTYVQDLTRHIEEWFEILSAGAETPVRDSLIPKVQEYILDNCLDSELSVSAISEHFSVNPSYLSNCFHNQTGIRLIDFIHHQRLNKVKELLRETNLSMAKIAECTGYYSAVSMSRAFKRYEGITPTTYRNS